MHAGGWAQGRVRKGLGIRRVRKGDTAVLLCRLFFGVFSSEEKNLRHSSSVLCYQRVRGPGLVAGEIDGWLGEGGGLIEERSWFEGGRACHEGTGSDFCTWSDLGGELVVGGPAMKGPGLWVAGWGWS